MEMKVNTTTNLRSTSHNVPYAGNSVHILPTTVAIGKKLRYNGYVANLYIIEIIKGGIPHNFM